MNEPVQFPMPIEHSTIDRLVDGELTAAEEKALLATLETQTDGWRLCALAFLEARAWKGELRSVVDDAAHPVNSTRINGTPIHGTSVYKTPVAVSRSMPGLNVLPRAAGASWTRALALAACIGLAFFLGMVSRGQWTQRGVATSNPAAQASGATASDSANRDGEYYSAKPTITMAVVNNQGGVERQFELPVVEADRLTPGWLARRPAAVSPQEVALLNDYGYRVDQERLYVPVVLDDGRQAIVSFDRASVKQDGLQF